MGQIIDLTNQKFGRLTALRRTGTNSHRSSVWECICDCKNIVFVSATALRSGGTKSCGCLRRDLQSEHQDLTGLKFGHLTVLYEVPFDQRNKSKRLLWFCKCVCDRITKVDSYSLTAGKITSCGCQQRVFKTHGKTKHPLFSIWTGMRKRCNNPKTEHFSCYGGKGVKVCVEWNDFQTFYEWSLSNGWVEELSIERNNTNGNYEPSNCRWIPLPEQANNRSSNIVVTINGVNYTSLKDAVLFHAPDNINAAYSRRANGWSLIEAIFRPQGFTLLRDRKCQT